MPTDTIRLDQPLDREMVRLFRGQLRRAHRSLRQPDDRSVHTARKAVKRSRAILRLVRPGLRPDRYRQVDRGVRAVGRQLGPIRDAAVALAVTGRLLAEGVLTPGAADRLGEYVRASAAEAHARLEAGGLDALRSDLRRLELADDDLRGLDVSHLALGLAETYARGRRRLADAVAEPSSEALHAWRRQVKHHGAQVALLVPAWPPVLRGAARAVADLADALGDDHDLAEFTRLATLARLPRRDLRAVRAAAETRCPGRERRGRARDAVTRAGRS